VLPAAVPPVVAADPPLDAVPLLLAAGALEGLVSSLLPPQAATPIASAAAHAPARIKRCMRFKMTPLPWGGS